jgi:hypothetical protein
MANEPVRASIKKAIDELWTASDEASDKHDKSEVDYKIATGKDRCGVCEYFEVERKNGCAKVKGFIEEQYWCDEFEREGEHKAGEKEAETAAEEDEEDGE